MWGCSRVGWLLSKGETAAGGRGATWPERVVLRDIQPQCLEQGAQSGHSGSGEQISWEQGWQVPLNLGGHPIAERGEASAAGGLTLYPPVGTPLQGGHAKHPLTPPAVLVVGAALSGGACDPYALLTCHLWCLPLSFQLCRCWKRTRVQL